MKYAYSIAEAAKALSLGRSSVYNLIKSGELERIKLGRRTLIPAQSIEALLEKARQDSVKGRVEKNNG